jgi:hypothetical protein
MIQNTDIADAQLRIADYLLTDTNIIDFCNTQFGKAPTVYAMDMRRKFIPTVKDCPYIVVYNFKKLEGMHVDFARYTATIVIGVSGDSNKELAKDDKGVIFDDTSDVCAKFMTLVQGVLNNYNDKTRPLSRCESNGPGPVETDGSHWVGFLNVQWRIFQTLGTNTEEF